MMASNAPSQLAFQLFYDGKYGYLQQSCLKWICNGTSIDGSFRSCDSTNYTILTCYSNERDFYQISTA